MDKMYLRWTLLFVAALQLCTLVSGQGPVDDGVQGKLDSRAAAAPAAPAPGGSNLLTQTVYGFLDFTTTIGNTVMVFSPQSAPPPESPTTEKLVIKENIIDTKPPKPQAANDKQMPEIIQPSKTKTPIDSNSGKSKPQVVLSSAVSVQSSEPEKKKNVEKPPAPLKPKETKQVVTKVEVVAGSSKVIEKQITPKPKLDIQKPVKASPPILSSKVEVKQGGKFSIPAPKFSSIVEVVSSSNNNEDEPAILVANNNIGEPEYDFLSRQPSEFVEETYKVVNIRPSKAHAQKPKHAPKHRAQAPTHPPLDDDEDKPVGVVTTLGGTIVKDGFTTVHETTVLGTYINGKYAQVLQSHSKILQHSGHKQKIAPSPTLRILKTAAPVIAKNVRYNLEPTPAASISEETVVPYDNSLGKSNRRQSGHGVNFKNRFRSHSNVDEDIDNTSPPQVKKNKSNRNPPSQQRNFSNRFGRASNTPELATVSVFSEPSSQSYSNRRKSNRNSGTKLPVVAPNNNDNHSPRRGFKPRLQPAPVEQVTSTTSTSLYKFKLNRQPGRWQYKTTPKPRVTIRKMGEDDSQTTPVPPISQDDLQANDVQSRSDSDLELSGSHSGPGSLLDNDADDNSIEKSPPVETLRVQISTPADFKDVYYEIATIKSPYTFQVGRVKNTRIITVTSTIEKRIETNVVSNVPSPPNEPLTENILGNVAPYDKEHNLLEPSIITLPAITLAGDIETPPLETVVDTFSTTQLMLKTHILPIVKGNFTDSLTFTQTYHVTRLVTATKTLPPMEYFQFIPSKTLKEFNSRLDEAGSELHLELDFGDSNEDEDGAPARAMLTDLDLANIGSDFDLSEIDKYRLPDNHLRLKKAHGPNNPKAQQVTEAPTPSTPALTPEQAQQLALLRLLNPAAAAQIPNVVTTSKPIFTVETVYESHVIPVFDGKNTVQSTISRPVTTITKTEYEIGTSVLPALPLPPINPLFPQQQFQLTSTPVVQHTEVTTTESQILKLTFGAKTVFTTLYSTKVIPTVLTTYVTQSVPIQQSAGFPGYYPSPFAPFPYVG